MLGFYLLNNIKLTELANIAEDQEVYLRDNLTDTYFDLRQDIAYTFTSEAGVFNKRFEIVFISQRLNSKEVTANNNNSNLLFVKRLNTEVINLSLINTLGQAV